MSVNETILSKQEKKWILEYRVTRLSDKKEVQIYPMGAERYLSSILFDNKKGRYDITADIENKKVLVIPGYGNSGFLFADAGAKCVTVYDKDPVTIAWIKAFKKFYHFRETSKDNVYPSIGEILNALTRWYPPLLPLPFGRYRNMVLRIVNPNLLRRSYIHYMLSLVRQAIQVKSHDNFELDKAIEFHVGTLSTILDSNEKRVFDTAFVPYLLGVKNGIESEKEIVQFVKELMKIVPNGHVLVNPSRSGKEFYITGKQYFVTTGYPTLQTIPDLQHYFKSEDKHWFRTQGLAVFSMQK